MKLYIENIAACILDIDGVVTEEGGEALASKISFIKKGRAAGLRFALISISAPWPGRSIRFSAVTPTWKQGRTRSG